MKFDEDCINVLKKVLFMEFCIVYGAFAYSVAGVAGVLAGMIALILPIVIGLILIGDGSEKITNDN